MIYPVIMSNILGISHIFHQGWKPIHPKQKPFPTARTKRSRKHTHANCWRQKIWALDVAAARDEVYPFVHDRDQLSLWSREFFLEIARRVRFCWVKNRGL